MMRRQTLVLAAMATAMAIPASSGMAQQMSKEPPPKVDDKRTLRLDREAVAPVSGDARLEVTLIAFERAGRIDESGR